MIRVGFSTESEPSGLLTLRYHIEDGSSVRRGAAHDLACPASMNRADSITALSTSLHAESPLQTAMPRLGYARMPLVILRCRAETNVSLEGAGQEGVAKFRDQHPESGSC